MAHTHSLSLYISPNSPPLPISPPPLSPYIFSFFTLYSLPLFLCLFHLRFSFFLSLTNLFFPHFSLSVNYTSFVLQLFSALSSLGSCSRFSTLSICIHLAWCWRSSWFVSESFFYKRSKHAKVIHHTHHLPPPPPIPNSLQKQQSLMVENGSFQHRIYISLIALRLFISFCSVKDTQNYRI